MVMNPGQDEAQKLEEDMEQRHAAELAALEKRERDAAGPQEETVSILNTDLYSFNLSAEETQKNVRHADLLFPEPPACCPMQRMRLFPLLVRNLACSLSAQLMSSG